MWTRVVRAVCFVFALWPAVAAAQEDLAVVGRKPSFLAGWAPPGQVVDASNAAVLRRRVSLTIDRMPLGAALREIARKANLTLSYNASAVSGGRSVTLRAEDITVVSALTEALLDTGLDVVVGRGGELTLVRSIVKRVIAAEETGVLVGRITNAKTGDRLPAAEVWLEGTRWRTTSAENGFYRLADVDVGNYTLAVRRVGFAKQTRAVAVTASQEVAADVALQPVVTQLNEIVTTVTGEQRRVELGHVVGVINADSLVREAPVSSLSELLTSRVPGLQVSQTQGTVGGRVTLLVRGANSLQLDNQPIVVIDGVRYTTASRERILFSGGPGDVEPSSPLNDLNVNDIESIEVVKGPSAATLYGTDAANGVLIVNTKRGRPGPARWNAYAKGTMTSIPTQDFPDIYWGWGTVSGVANNPNVSCTLSRLVSGICSQQDSIAVLPNPLNTSNYSIFGHKPRWNYGANVAGGQQDLRYYLSGDFENATGPIQLPAALVEQLKTARGLTELPEEWREPNAFTKLSLRSNVTAVLGKRADLRMSTGYIRNTSRALSRDQNPYTSQFSQKPSNANAPYGSGSDPAQAFAQTSTETSDRFVGNASGQWRPLEWLTTRATIGLDFIGTQQYGLVRPGDMPDGYFPDGSVEDTRVRQLATSADLGAAATVRWGRLSARTAVGTQYVRTLNTTSGSYGIGLPPGGSVPATGTVVYTAQRYQETILLGGYAEEMLGINDRLFLTGAVRIDGASTFGQDYSAALYPKIGVSWLVSDEPFIPRIPGLDQLRLRYAFGAAGKQPNPRSARPFFSTDRAVIDGQLTTLITTIGLGNPEIRPERVREHEFGFDVTALANRVTLDATWYRRRTIDQIVSEPGPPARGSMDRNLGLTTQHGFEVQLNVHALDTRPVSLDFALQHADYRTKLVDIGTGSSRRTSYGGWVEGYPLGARFDWPVVGWSDVNGDGIIARSEVQIGNAPVYLGVATPPRSETLTAVLGLLERRVRLSAALDRRTGFTASNSLWCGNFTCRAAVDPSTPLPEQAKATMVRGPGFEKGDYTRLREVSVALDLPTGFARAARVRSATLVFSARNLALWTKFSGPDPESGSVMPTIEPLAPNQGVSGIPQDRAFSLRLDLGL